MGINLNLIWIIQSNISLHKNQEAIQKTLFLLQTILIILYKSQ